VIGKRLGWKGGTEEVKRQGAWPEEKGRERKGREGCAASPIWMDASDRSWLLY